jgi:hypothetical protein
MTLSALGIFSAAGAGGAVSDYELISTTILGSNQATVVFSGLSAYSSTYKHLQLRYTARTNRDAVETQIYLQTNSNTSATYFIHRLEGNGSSVVSSGGGSSNPSIGLVTTANSTANSFGAGIVEILDAYSTTKNKTIRILNGATGLSPNYINLLSYSIANTAAISTLTVNDIVSSGIVTGSRFSLYGIKG